MKTYEITCIDSEGDELKIELFENGLANASIDADKFSLNLNPDKLKRLIESIHGIKSLLSDFEFRKLEIEAKEER